MESMNKVILLIAICVLWLGAFFFLPKTREKRGFLQKQPSLHCITMAFTLQKALLCYTL